MHSTLWSILFIAGEAILASLGKILAEFRILTIVIGEIGVEKKKVFAEMGGELTSIAEFANRA
jgi:hypothetical protein